MGLFKKQYMNVVSVETKKDLETIVTKEAPGETYGYDYGNYKDVRNHKPSEGSPVRLTIQKPRNIWTAMKKAYEYSKMNIFNMIIKVNTN